MTEQRPMTATEVKAKMIALHAELSNFRFYLAMNSGTIPRAPEEEDAKAIDHVLESIEHEVSRIKLVENRQAVDSMIHESLERAGFKPDEPTAGDSK